MKATIGQWLGYLGLTLSAVAGANWPDPRWGMFVLGLLVASAGIFLRRTAGAPPIESSKDGGPALSLREIVGKVAEEAAALVEKAQGMHLEAVKTELERILNERVERFAAAQEAVSQRLGFPAYADVMGPLATSERLLQRAWSAATDGHRAECIDSLRQAIAHAEEARIAAESRLGTL